MGMKSSGSIFHLLILWIWNILAAHDDREGASSKVYEGDWKGMNNVNNKKNNSSCTRLLSCAIWNYNLIIIFIVVFLAKISLEWKTEYFIYLMAFLPLKKKRRGIERTCPYINSRMWQFNSIKLSNRVVGFWFPIHCTVSLVCVGNHLMLLSFVNTHDEMFSLDIQFNFLVWTYILYVCVYVYVMAIYLVPT